MHSLETIHKRNVEDFLLTAEGLRKQGNHVLVTYDGTAVTAFEAFSDEAEAFAALHGAQDAAKTDPSRHFKMLLPSGLDIGADRPQLLDNDPDDPVVQQDRQPGLTPEEEVELNQAASYRDGCATALQAAALAFANAQAHCTTLAERLRDRIQAEEDARQQSLAP